MKKIAMFTMGTRGDIQPYIFLAQELNKNGYDVLVGSHPCWRKLVEESGVKFVPIGPDIDIEKEAAIIRGKNKNPVLSMLKTMNFVFDIIVKSTDEVFEACKGMDLIVVSHSQMGATEAEVLGIPTVNVTLQTEMIPERLKKQTLLSKMIGGFIAGQVAKPYNKIRKKYDLKPAKDIGMIMSSNYDLIPISQYAKERNPYWEPHHVFTGFWYQEAKDYKPNEELEKFLKNGDKPILLTLGAMSFEDKSEVWKLDMFVKAFEKTGYRAIIQGFQKSLQQYTLPASMIAVGSVPHSYLFDKCQMVIHHCGFGTTAATLIYGVPSIPVPHVLDQRGQADMLKKLGVATDVLDGHKLTEEKIITCIEDMKLNYEERSRNVKQLSEKMKKENGLQVAVNYIKEII